MLQEIKAELKNLNNKLSELEQILKIPEKSVQLEKLEALMAATDFWNNQEKANQVIVEVKALNVVVGPYRRCQELMKDLAELAEIVENDDKKSLAEINDELAQLNKLVNDLEFKTLFSDPDDSHNAIISIHAGAGGTESCDWAAMLFRMYSRWAERKKFSLETIDFLPGEEAGIKNITVIIKGPLAFGYLKSERGVHRLVRISPFDANKRRHTSFASVDAIAEVSDDIDIKIEEKDIRVDVYRSSGPGGQGVNTTDSAVRITHIETNIIVSCQNERSQLKNKRMAMSILRARLHELEKEKKEKEIQDKYDAKQKIEWGSQIRSYVMHPYSMVKDHRSKYETSNVQAVMDGDLDKFSEEFLRWKVKNV